jgi:hypothetical protein
VFGVRMVVELRGTYGSGFVLSRGGTGNGSTSTSSMYAGAAGAGAVGGGMFAFSCIGSDESYRLNDVCGCGCGCVRVLHARTLKT